MQHSPRQRHEPGAVVESLAHPATYGLRQKSGLLLGPLFLLLPLLLPAPGGLSAEAWRVTGAAFAMAALWVSEAVPIPATALLPVVLFPLLGICPVKQAAAPYAHPVIFLFLGGSLLALAMRRWGLHRLFAARIVAVTGHSPRGIILGFLLASAFVSMWVNNTATTLMLLPVGAAVADAAARDARPGAASGAAEFRIGLLLAIAYGSSIGGMGTLIGTAPNAFMAAFLSQTCGREIGFGQWMLFAVPVAGLMLPVAFLILTRWAVRVPRCLGSEEGASLRAILAGTERPGFPGLAVGAVFALTVLLWICQPLLEPRLPMLTDTVIGLSGALLLFFIPALPRKGEFVMDWGAAKQLPWDVLLLFGGGLSLAAQIEATGLAKALGSLPAALPGADIMLLVAVTAVSVLALTEFASNTATAAAFLPVVAALAAGMGRDPLLLVIPAALASSCAFMLPVATPPNAIVFSAGGLPLLRMAKAGLFLNLAFLFLIWLAMLSAARLVFGIR